MRVGWERTRAQERNSLLLQSYTRLSDIASPATVMETILISLMSILRLGPAVSLKGSPTVSPMTDDRGAMRAGTLAAVVAFFDVFLGVVPGAAGIGEKHRQGEPRG